MVQYNIQYNTIQKYQEPAAVCDKTGTWVLWTASTEIMPGRHYSVFLNFRQTGPGPQDERAGCLSCQLTRTRYPPQHKDHQNKRKELIIVRSKVGSQNGSAAVNVPWVGKQKTKLSVSLGSQSEFVFTRKATASLMHPQRSTTSGNSIHLFPD